MDRSHRTPWWTPLAVLLLAGAGPAACAADPAAPVFPFWSLPGDSVAADTRLTLGAGILDVEGAADKLADDEGLVDELRPLALWSHRGAAGEDGRLETRGLIVGDDRTTALVSARLNVPGGRDLRLRYVRSLHYDDPTADDPYLPDGAMRTLPGRPALRRDGLAVAWRQHLGPGWSVGAGYAYTARSGRRAGLARGLVSPDHVFGPPDALPVDTWTHRAHLDGRLTAGRLSFDWAASLQQDGGERIRRSVDDPTSGPGIVREARRTVDRRAWSLRAGSTWEAGSRWLLFGSYGYRQDRSDPEERRDPAGGLGTGDAVAADAVQVDARTHTGLLGCLFHPRPWLRIRLTGRWQRLDQVGRSDAAGIAGILAAERNSLDRERNRQTWALDLSHAGFRRARYGAGYAYERGEEATNILALDEYLGGNLLLRARASDRDRTVHTLHFKGRQRLGRRLTLHESVRHRSEDVDQRDAVREGLYAQGDRQWRRTRGEVKLRSRLAPAFHLDAGYQFLREAFERGDIDGVRTDWDADRLFASAAFLPDPRLSLFLAFSIGWEDYGIEGAPATAPADPAVYNPVAYDARTYRLAPAVVLHPTARLTLEGGYERVRNRESVANDGDRWHAHLRRDLGDRLSLTAGYRRYEFTALRGDDYVADLYSLAVTLRR